MEGKRETRTKTRLRNEPERQESKPNRSQGYPRPKTYAVYRLPLFHSLLCVHISDTDAIGLAAIVWVVDTLTEPSHQPSPSLPLSPSQRISFLEHRFRGDLIQMSSGSSAVFYASSL
jgi:hypothetical protein